MSIATRTLVLPLNGIFAQLKLSIYARKTGVPETFAQYCSAKVSGQLFEKDVERKSIFNVKFRDCKEVTFNIAFQNRTFSKGL